MSPPGHALSGLLAVTAAVYALPGTPEGRHRLILWAVFGSLAPDIDAVSLLFSHDTYFGLAWYSHRGFLHSLAGCALVAMLFPRILHSLRSRGSRGVPPGGASLRASALATFAGGLVHLIGDLPTPPGSWGGLPLFFPLPLRVGGWSHIGWINAALLYLLGAGALAAGALAAAHHRAPPAYRPWLRGCVIGVSGLALAGTLWFSAISRYEGTLQWRAWQARFIPVVWIDALHELGRPTGVFWEREVLSGS